MGVSGEAEPPVQPAAAGPGGAGAGGQEHLPAREPPSAAAADGAGDDEEGRLSAAGRKRWVFRSLIGLFVVFELAVVGIAVGLFLKDDRQGWIGGGAVLFFAGLIAVLIWEMAQRYGWDRREPEPGAPIPMGVRKSRRWKAGLWWWAFFGCLLTGSAVGIGLSQNWPGFAIAALTALLCWIRVISAARGKVPPDLPDQ